VTRPVVYATDPAARAAAITADARAAYGPGCPTCGYHDGTHAWHCETQPGGPRPCEWPGLAGRRLGPSGGAA
jgi:hypothetical protein